MFCIVIYRSDDIVLNPRQTAPTFREYNANARNLSITTASIYSLMLRIISQYSNINTLFFLKESLGRMFYIWSLIAFLITSYSNFIDIPKGGIDGVGNPVPDVT